MDALVAYGSGSEERDNGEQQLKQKQANHDEEDICREIPVSETSIITTMDLPPSSRVPLPLELNCEIFKCLKLPIQRKFIWGLGRDIYGMFGQKLLKKTKRVCNPDRNVWNRATTRAIISRDGLRANNEHRMTNIYAEKGFAISGKHSRTGSFPGTIIYYYEVKLLTKYWFMIGLSNENGMTKGGLIGNDPNSYAIVTGYPLNLCYLAGDKHLFELPDGAVQPEIRVDGMDVYGCGILMDPNDKLAIFFTLNGILMGRQTPISPSMDDYLFPAVAFVFGDPSIEANFGNDKDKPFEYDIKKCPGIRLDCI